MRVIKLAFLSIIIFLIVVTFVSFIIPSHIRISRNIRIIGSKENVMAQIGNPANWKNWYPGADSLELFFVNGEVKGIRLDSLQTLVIKSKNDSIITAVNADLGLKKIISNWNIISENGSGKLTVQWYMDFHLGWYPWEKFRSLLYEKSYGVQMESGLEKLKHLIEGNQSKN